MKNRLSWRSVLDESADARSPNNDYDCHDMYYMYMTVYSVHVQGSAGNAGRISSRIWHFQRLSRIEQKEQKVGQNVADSGKESKRVDLRVYMHTYCDSV